MTQADAHAALAHFLRRAQHDGARVVLVITGKGARPGGDPYAERGVLGARCRCGWKAPNCGRSWSASKAPAPATAGRGAVCAGAARAVELRHGRACPGHPA